MSAQTVVIDIAQIEKQMAKRQKTEDRLEKSIKRTKSQMGKIDSSKGKLDLKVTDITIKVLNKIAKGLERGARALEDLPQRMWKVMNLFLKEFNKALERTNSLLRKILDKLGISSILQNRQVVSAKNPVTSKVIELPSLKIPKKDNFDLKSGSTAPAEKPTTSKTTTAPSVKILIQDNSNALNAIINQTINTAIRIFRDVEKGFTDLGRGLTPLKNGLRGLIAREYARHRTSFLETSKNVGVYLGTLTMGAANSMKSFFTGRHMNGIGNIVEQIGIKISNALVDTGLNIESISSSIFSGFFSVVGIVKGIISGVVNFFKNIAKAVWEGIKKWGIEPIMKHETTIGTATGYQKMVQQMDDPNYKTINEFEEAIYKVGMVSPYGVDNSMNIAKNYLNSGKFDDLGEIRDTVSWIQDLAVAYGGTEDTLSTIASNMMRYKGDTTTASLNNISTTFQDIPVTQLMATALGENREKVEQRINNGEFSNDDIVGLVKKAVGKELSGSAEEFTNGTLTGLKAKLSNMFDVKISKKWGKSLSEGLSTGFKSIGSFLDEHAGVLDNIGNALKNLATKMSTALSAGIETTLENINNLIGSKEFDSAKPAEKMEMFWRQVIQDPFNEWWAETGEETVGKVLDIIGEKTGQGLTAFLSILFGLDENNAIKDGKKAGVGFASGFARGFDSEMVVEAFSDMLSRLLKRVWEKLWSSKNKDYSNRNDLKDKDKYFDKDGNPRPGVDVDLLATIPVDPMTESMYTSKLIYYGDEGIIEAEEKTIGIREQADKSLQARGSTKTFEEALKDYENLEPKELIIVDDALKEFKKLNEEYKSSGISKYNEEIKNTIEARGQTTREVKTEKFNMELENIKKRTEQNFLGAGFENQSFDEAIQNYDSLGEKQREILDEGLGKILELNKSFDFLHEPKYLDIIVRVFGEENEIVKHLIRNNPRLVLPKFNGNTDLSGITLPQRFGSTTSNGVTDNIFSIEGVTAKAKGGILTAPQISLVAEAGPEAIIPLSGAYKERGISLWEQAGELLGIYPHAKGGIFGSFTMPRKKSYLYKQIEENKNIEETKEAMEAPAKIDIGGVQLGGINFTFQGTEANSREGIMAVIKEQMPNIADEIAATIAINIQKVFANMKKQTA